jgi:sec-independent protein translocase protein TatA
VFGSLGIGEIMLIAGIALIVIGPEKFPEFAKIVMRTVRDLRGYVNEVQREVADELRPIKNEVNKLSRYKPEDYIDALTKDEANDQPDEGLEDTVAYQKDGDYAEAAAETDEPEPPEGSIESQGDESDEMTWLDKDEAQPNSEQPASQAESDDFDAEHEVQDSVVEPPPEYYTDPDRLDG